MRADLTFEAGDAIPQPLRKVEFIHGLNADRSLFISNIEANSARPVPRLRFGRAVLVAGGPSAREHLDDVRKLKSEGWQVYTVNGAHDWLIREGITPDACVTIESNAVADTLIREPRQSCVYYLASQVNQNLFNRLVDGRFPVKLFHIDLDAEAIKTIERVDPEPTILACANTVGLHALGVLYTLGTRRVKVFGIDSSFRDDGDHAYDNSQQHKADVLEFVFKGESFKATGTWAAQAEMFAKVWPMYFRLGMRIEVFGDGLLPAMYRHEKEKLMTELLANRTLSERTD